MKPPSHPPRHPPRVLLAGVFGPYGVDDAYGRKENIMELFHNQVTKAQGVASFRFFHRSFGLYFLAENIDADTTVLDFPSRDRYIRELARGWDVVGISFITPNFRKAREMARLARRHAPGAQIILGGHGAAIEGVEGLIDCDKVIRGEGIRPLRRLLGQDPDAPITHPILPSTERQAILGVPLPGRPANLLVPGVGCVNGCDFCCTSHFFGCAATPYLSTGQAIFDTACRVADATGSDEFFVMDENFLKDRARARELLALMEEHERFFDFRIFSSAEAIEAFGLDELVRLGVSFVWLGVESNTAPERYAKNRGVDMARLVRGLRDRGVSVLASGILCMDHHTPDNIQEDIDHLVGLEADFVQFMQLIALPVTPVYQRKKAEGRLRDDLPFEEWHGQKRLNHAHPAFPGDSAERWLGRAFRQDYEDNGSSMLRVIDTAFRGARRLAALRSRDACAEARRAQFVIRTRQYALVLPMVLRFAVNDQERARARTLEGEIWRELGPLTATERILRAAIQLSSRAWAVRLALLGDGVQPDTLVTRYRASTAARRLRRAARAPRIPRAIAATLTS